MSDCAAESILQNFAANCEASDLAGEANRHVTEVSKRITKHFIAVSTQDQHKLLLIFFAPLRAVV
jgi:hypothetical protein